MRVINVRNVHLALPKGLSLLQEYGVIRNSRNGPVTVMEEPVTTKYTRPKERVMFWAERDANPFFHFFESLWMMAGRNDLAFLTQFVKRFADFSDDGVILHGAYGHRWFNHFNEDGYDLLPDQLAIIVDRLTRWPEDRRSVLQMWDPEADLGQDSKDVPCNLTAHFQRNREGALDMTVFCRSNDIIWGAYGANAVHFSVLQEWVAAAIGCKMGKYWQISDNFHAYHTTMVPLMDKFYGENSKDPTIREFNPYNYEDIRTYPLVSVEATLWLKECEHFITYPGADHEYNEPFFERVARPLYAAHEAHKHRDYTPAIRLAEQCWATDWRKAAIEWLKRREQSYKKAQDDGPDYTT